MAIDPTLKGVLESLEDIGKQLAALNDTPNTAPEEPVKKGVADDSTDFLSKRVMSLSDQMDIRAKLRTKSTAELSAMFGIQAQRHDAGIPFDMWANAGGSSVQSAIAQDINLTKALDTGGATALIRQDLEPILYELYVREFPAWERFSKEPANGLVHAYNQITNFGDAQFMTELGTVTDDQTTYVRKTTPVSVIATRRGTSLRSQYAVRAGGMSWNPEQLELQGGLRAIAHRMQKTIFQGQATNSGGIAAGELGLYDVNAFDGLRSILNQATVKNCNPQASPTTEDMREFLDRATEEIVNAGGSANAIYCRPTEKITFDLQQDKNVRYQGTFTNVVPGVMTNAVNTIVGPLPLIVIPGDSIGHYNTLSADGSFNGGEDVADMYILDEATVSMPYLGSEGVTVLDIPIGISGQLTHLYIMFGMWGLVVKALPFSNKVRIKQA
jgi:hypothetical protein